VDLRDYALPFFEGASPFHASVTTQKRCVGAERWPNWTATSS
jgi:hypothetical protein